jgi:hypothetical protein
VVSFFPSSVSHTAITPRHDNNRTKLSRQFNKEISNGRWRAYSKGTIELCEKYSAFAIKGRATLADAPKDVRRLEALKPANVPSMGERYDAAVAKERRLEAATQPMMRANKKKADDAMAKKGGDEKDGSDKRKRKDEDEESDLDLEEEGGEAKSKPKKKKKKAAAVNEADLKNVEALKEDDDVQEGIVWSSDSE